MTLDLDETIAAIATAPGGEVRGIVRVSGTRCASVLEALFQSDPEAQTLDPHPSALPRGEGTAELLRWPQCRRGTMQFPRELGRVPVVVYFWPTERSYTRQPSAEFHLPGSPPVLEAALEAVCGAGARLARPGEFTLRAFLAGRLDLTQAEAVLGVIEAQGRRELEGALAQLAGGLARPLAALREQLLDLLAQLEAGLDFVEEDIEFVSAAELERQLTMAVEGIRGVMEQMRSRGEAAALPRVVIAGRPNVGKSSLLNALAGEEAAIVSEVAGTTRDFVARRVRVGARECLVMDTAGVRADAEGGEVERAAIVLAREEAEQADLTLLCVDFSSSRDVWETEQIYRSDGGSRLLVWTKCDLASANDCHGEQVAIRTSSRTGAGIESLREAIGRALEGAKGEVGVVASTADRCRESLRLAGEAMERARLSAAGNEELVAAEIREALDELGRVVGAVYTEDILDRVFSRFCIGK